MSTEFHDRLRAQIDATNTSQYDLANKLNISATSISLYMIGARMPGGNNLVPMAQALNTSVDYLLGLTDDPTPPTKTPVITSIPTHQIFGIRITKRMNECKIKQSELADVIGVKYTTISQYMHGQFIPNAKSLKQLAIVLSTTTDYLLGNTPITEDIPSETYVQILSKTFASRLKSRLKDNNMSQKQLSETTGIIEAAISRYVAGTRIPSGDTLIRIADALDTTTDYLLGRTIQPEPGDTNPIRNSIYKKTTELNCEELHVIETTIDIFIKNRKEVTNA